MCTALENHVTVHGVLQEACAALANLSHDPAATDEAKASGGATYVAAAMAAHIDDERMQRFGIAVLDNLGVSGILAEDEHRLHTTSYASSVGFNNASQIAQLSSAARVCAAMKAHTESTALLEIGCRALANLSQENESVRRSVVHLGGPQLVCDAMQRFLDHTNIQRRGCAALANMAYDESASAVVTAGGVDAILQAMEAHLADPTVQEEGCSVLSNLSCGDSTVRPPSLRGDFDTIKSKVT